MKVMLTGGCGHIGRRVVARLEHAHDLVVVDRVPHPEGWPGRVEILDLTRPEELDRLDEPFDAIVHLAAIPNPFHDPWEEVLRVNLVSTFNVLRYAAQRGIPKVIFGSSESASGWGIHGKWYRPNYLPIDENHPSLPSEVYSFTKAFGDQLCQGFSREHGLRTLCLRYCFVTFPALYDSFLATLKAPGPREALGATYAWIDVEDVASAIACALDFDPGEGVSETFYLTAREHFGTLPTLELARRNWGPDLPVDRAYYADNPFGSFFDIRKAQRLLGWQPEWSVQRLLETYG